jgi:hypothetical protein
VNGEPSEISAQLLALMSTAEFRAVELYRRGESPVELGQLARSCGAVVLWTR